MSLQNANKMVAEMAKTDNSKAGFSAREFYDYGMKHGVSNAEVYTHFLGKTNAVTRGKYPATELDETFITAAVAKAAKKAAKKVPKKAKKVAKQKPKAEKSLVPKKALRKAGIQPATNADLDEMINSDFNDDLEAGGLDGFDGLSCDMSEDESAEGSDWMNS